LSAAALLRIVLAVITQLQAAADGRRIPCTAWLVLLLSVVFYQQDPRHMMTSTVNLRHGSPACLFWHSTSGVIVAL